MLSLVSYQESFLSLLRHKENSKKAETKGRYWCETGPFLQFNSHESDNYEVVYAYLPIRSRSVHFGSLVEFLHLVGVDCLSDECLFTDLLSDPLWPPSWPRSPPRPDWFSYIAK